MSIRLRTQITADTPVGTLIDGSIASNVLSKKKEILIPAGSPVHGRLRRLERYRDDPSPHFVVGLEFTEVELKGARLRFYADLAIQSAPGIEQTLATSSDTDLLALDGTIRGFKQTRQAVRLPPLPGVATLFYRGSKLDLPKDFETDWKSRQPNK